MFLKNYIESIKDVWQEKKIFFTIIIDIFVYICIILFQNVSHNKKMVWEGDMITSKPRDYIISYIKKYLIIWKLLNFKACSV